ncbi:MAG: YhcH/YjgK/YiaL family protein [Clostridium saudiense]|uniref:YhcH/YjgK/YiaL family protein n=1 Tax=Clostridium saudiense TaxID=1414720 RepID=UPI003996C51E
MIIDKITNCKFYFGLGEKFEKAFKYLEETDLENLECGKHIIDGDNIFASVGEYYTKNADECLWEAHRKYIDIQYIIQGQENMGYSNISNIETTIEYNSESDVLFGNGNGQFITVNQGEFIIFTQEDAHMPSLKVDESTPVKKVVVKIVI